MFASSKVFLVSAVAVVVRQAADPLSEPMCWGLWEIGGDLKPMDVALCFQEVTWSSITSWCGLCSAYGGARGSLWDDDLLFKGFVCSF